MATNEDFAQDPRIAHYYSLEPFKYNHVERLEIRQDCDADYAMVLEIELRHADPGDDRRLFLAFNGVRNLRLTPPLQHVLSMSQLEVRSIRDQQWEGMNYRVVEVEDDTISFLCRDFTARVHHAGDD